MRLHPAEPAAIATVGGPALRAALIHKRLIRQRNGSPFRSLLGFWVMSGGRSRRWWVWITALVVMVVAVGITVACTRPRDSRAYPNDSGDMPLKQGLKLFAIVMPDCPTQDLRYALVGSWGGHDLYLSFSASSECMQSFVKLNDMRDGGEVSAPGVEFQASTDLKQVGWRFAADRKYHRYDANRTGGRPFEVIIDTTLDLQVVYLFGFPV